MQKMEEPPSAVSNGDVMREIGRAAASIVPIAGGAIQILFENIFASPLERRKQEWLESVAEAINDLRQKFSDITPEKLAANDVFITVALTAFPIAIRNHQEYKLNALRNAVINSALPNSIDENEKLIFLRLVDRLTPWHLRILFLFQNPKECMEQHGISAPSGSFSSISFVIERCFPDLASRQDVYEQIIRDLQIEGLVQQGNITFTTMTAAGVMDPRATPLGNRFARFISPPGV